MKPLDALRIAIIRVRSRLLESLLLVIGVALGVGVISSTLSLYAAVSSSMGGDQQLRQISAKVPDASSPRSTSVRRVQAAVADQFSLLPDDIDAVKAASTDVAYGYFGGLFSPSPGSEELTGIIAGDYFAAFGLHVAEGTLFTPEDETSGAKVAILGARKAKLLFPDGNAIGSSVQVAGMDYSVIGVLAPTSDVLDPDRPPPDDLSFVPVRSLAIFQRMRSIPSITFVARSQESIPRAVEQVKAFYNARFGRGAIEVTARLDEIERERRQIDGVLVVLLAFAGAGLLIASINMLNVLLSRVARRVRATGIAIALGERRAGVFRSNLLESLVLGLTGCLAGIPCALAFNALLQQLFSEGPSDDLRVLLPPLVAVAAAGAALAANLLFALYPAWRAARMTAADAIRAE